MADHQTVQEFYAKIEQETPGLGRVLRAVDVDPPGRLVANPQKWAADQEQRIAERLAPTVDAALVKARHFEEQAAKAEANVVVLSARVRELETAYKTARGADVPLHRWRWRPPPPADRRGPRARGTGALRIRQ